MALAWADRIIELWRAGSLLNTPILYKLRWRLFEYEFLRALPWLVLFALAMSGFLFASLPRLTGSAYLGLLGSVWGLWVTWAAPIVVSLALAVSVAPRLATDIAYRDLGGEFALLAQAGHSAAVFPGLPMVVAMGQLGAACVMVLILVCLMAGFLIQIFFNVSGAWRLLYSVLGAVSPWTYGLAALKAGCMLMFAGLAVVLHSWPTESRKMGRNLKQGFGIRAVAWALLGTLFAATLLMWLEYALGVF